MGKFSLASHYKKFKILTGFKFLCVLLFLPIFSYAASSVDQDPSLPDQLSGVVYVSNSTTMYGADQMYIVTNKDANEKDVFRSA